MYYYYAAFNAPCVGHKNDELQAHVIVGHDPFFLQCFQRRAQDFCWGRRHRVPVYWRCPLLCKGTVSVRMSCRSITAATCSWFAAEFRRQISTERPVWLPAVLLFSRPRSEGWPHHGRTFSIYLCPLTFWLILTESCQRPDVVHPGRAWSSSPACTWHCSLHYFFLQATTMLHHGVTIVC